MKRMEGPAKSIVLIDGECQMCQTITRFLVKHDRHFRFAFAALQSEAGQNLLQHHGLNQAVWDSFVLIENGGLHIKSGAALRVAKRLGGWWSFLYVFIIVPAPIRDYVYEWVARNRYRWFGRTDACLMPTKEVMSRFLKDGYGTNTR
ncbi:thiol-disulfide oxidoreductase DCC family protein [Paenibacillus sp. M.A.Huq-81]